MKLVTTQCKLLNHLYLQAASDLLSVHDIQADVLSEPDLKTDAFQSCYVSVLGATGVGIALSSVVKISRELLVFLHPFGSPDIPAAHLADYCRELNNQLVGRMKNKMLRYGVTLTLGLPVLLTGKDVSAVASPDSTLQENAIKTPRGSVALILESIVDPDLQLEEVESADEAMLEGAVALF